MRIQPALGSLCALAVFFLTWNSQGAKPAWGEFSQKPDAWYQGAEGRTVVSNILSWQSSAGSWPKNLDTTKPFRGEDERRGTFDNGASLGELRFLARAFRLTKEPSCQRAFLKGFDHILQAQYPNGGWPQSFPPGTGYARHITFNDETMVQLMRFLREAATDSNFDFLDSDRRKKAREGFDHGVQCILKCQVVVDGKKTVWCAQHDEISFAPRPARSYELVSLSGAESAGILLLLITLENPSQELRDSITSGAAWFEAVKIKGIREVRVDGDKRIEKDPSAPLLWARFYEIGSHRPFFSGRDGIKKYDIAEIESERRNGYGWYGNWGEKVAQAFGDWQKKFGPGKK